MRPFYFTFFALAGALSVISSSLHSQAINNREETLYERNQYRGDWNFRDNWRNDRQAYLRGENTPNYQYREPYGTSGQYDRGSKSDARQYNNPYNTPPSQSNRGYYGNGQGSANQGQYTHHLYFQNNETIPNRVNYADDNRTPSETPYNPGYLYNSPGQYEYIR